MKRFPLRSILLLLTIVSIFFVATQSRAEDKFFNVDEVDGYFDEDVEESSSSANCESNNNNNDVADFDFQQGQYDDFEVDEVGNVHLGDQEPNLPPLQFSANFENNYDEPLELYWLDEENNDELFHMGDIDAGTSVGVNTFPGHRFLAKIKDSGVTAYPKLHVVTPANSVYTFYPVRRFTSRNEDEERETVALPPKRSPPRKENTINQKQKKANTHRNEEEETISDENFAVYDVPKPFIQLLNQKSTSASAKFRSLVPSPIDVWYDDGKEGIFQGNLDLGKEYTVNSYEGHVFYFTARGNKSKVYARHKVSSDKVLYVIEDPDHPAPKSMLDHLEKEEAFMADYLTRSDGRVQWRHYFGPDGRPRPPPTLPMWPATQIGQVHHVKAAPTAGYWTCLNYQNPTLCHAKKSIDLTLEVISTKPKVFIIKDFLSEMEVNAIISYAKPRMDSSFVGNSDAGGARKSDTRTSENTWIPRAESFPVMETLFHRAEQVLNISRLDRTNTEDLQVVHYLSGQRYDSHHDWGVSGYPESRYITLLLYLTDMVSQDAGGETAFPKAAGGKGLKIHPGKGSAVLFYNLLEDGNGDDLTLHAALPVKKGEKWLANFWVWDPKRK